MASSENAPILTNVKSCLALYPHEDWLEIEEQLASASQLQPEVQSYQRFVVSGAVECPFDSQGRILVPAMHRESADLGRDVCFVGAGDRLRVFSKDNYAQVRQQFMARLDDASGEGFAGLFGAD